MAGVKSPASLHDVELAALAAAGDRPAFGELVRRHGAAVRGLLRRMGAEPSLADDIAQDAFLAAFERIVEFRLVALGKGGAFVLGTAGMSRPKPIRKRQGFDDLDATAQCLQPFDTVDAIQCQDGQRDFCPTHHQRTG